MENKLKRLFDYQKFENNRKLAELVYDTENRYPTELSDNDLSKVAAAGDPDLDKAKTVIDNL